MIFEGMRPWTPAEPLVELYVDDQRIDLHNWASYLGFEFRYPETLIVTFDYDSSEGGFRPGSTSLLVRVVFGGVANLMIEYEQLEEQYEGDTLCAFIYQKLRPGRGHIDVVLMDGFTLRFEAGSVSVEQIEMGSPLVNERPGEADA